MSRRAEHPQRKCSRGYASSATPLARSACFLIALLIASTGNGAQPPSPAEQLAAYLEECELDSQHALLLELELRSARSERRNDLAQRLTRVYARLLENARTPEERAALEARAGAILAAVPDADTLELRLTLARSAYSHAEQAAEKWRLRLNSRADADAARRSFIELERAFSEVASAAAVRVSALEKQDEAASESGPERALLAAALAGARRTRSLAHFLAGWSAYYIGELDPAGAGVAVPMAIRHFGTLLNARSGQAPTIDRVPEHLLSYEHVARAAIGVALSESLTVGPESALRWLQLIESAPNVTDPVRRQLTARRMIVLARGARWADLAVLVDPRGGGSSASSIDPTEARLLAVLALEARQSGARTADVQPLIVLSLEALASRGEVAQVLDLASRYFDRLDDFDARGFMASYIRGLREYDRAERLRDSFKAGDDEPVSDEPTRRAYASAAGFLNDALGSSDAAQFASAIGGVSLVRAFSLFYSGRSPADFERAAVMFREAAAKLDSASDALAPQARLFAIRSIDVAKQAAPAPDPMLDQTRRTLVDEFLARHSDSPSAAAFLFERALSSGRSPRHAVRDLLAIPDDSPLAPLARYQAARLLYERYLSAPPGDRAAASAEFLAVAESLLESDRRTLRVDDQESVLRALTTGRRVLDCLLRDPESDPSRARRTLDFVASLIDRGAPVTPQIRAEVAYRSMQLALRAGQWSEAEAVRRDIASLDPSLAPAALRAVYQHAADLLQQEDMASPARLDHARRVISLGSEVIRDQASSGASIADPAVATLHAVVAAAAAEVFAATGDPEAGALATHLYKGLTEAHPTDAGFLRSAAAHAEHAGDTAAALNARRALLAGLPQGSSEWFENKCRVIDLLIEADPAAAREALVQHRVLHPELGPEPWRSRLLELERKLRSVPAGSAPPSKEEQR